MTTDKKSESFSLEDIFCIHETSSGITHIGVLFERQYYGLGLNKPKMVMIDDNGEAYLDEPMFVGSSEGHLIYSDTSVYTLFTPSDYFKAMYIDYENEITIDGGYELEDTSIISDTVH